MAKIADIRDRSVDQLGDDLVRLKKEQFNLRFQRASGQLENTARFRVVRRDIARVLTVLGQRAATPETAPSAPVKKKAMPRVGKAAAPAVKKKPAKRAGTKK